MAQHLEKNIIKREIPVLIIITNQCRHLEKKKDKFSDQCSTQIKT